jgi:aryl sulfotransferase
MGSAAADVLPPRVMIDTRMVDSSRWDHVKLRDDDIIVATWSKTGTTLTQQMVWQLITGGAEGVASVTVSPWVDNRMVGPAAPMAAMLEAQTERRVMKTHAPFESTPFSPSVKYVYIGRDARDVVWSLYNHLASFSDATIARLNAQAGPWPKTVRPEAGERALYLEWLETDRFPGAETSSFWDHVQGWWDQRRRPNVLLLHYANLIADRTGEMRRIARFLDIAVDEARLPAMSARCEIDYMREQARDSRLGAAFKDGAASFFNQGTNGRWREVLSPEEAALCDDVAAQRLTPDCAHWLKTGELLV